jgi:hypothetical protein
MRQPKNQSQPIRRRCSICGRNLSSPSAAAGIVYRITRVASLMQKPIQLISANLLSLFRSWVDQRIGCRRYRYEARFLGVALAPPFFAKKLPASSPSFAVYKSLTSLLNNLLCTMLFYRQSLTPINTLTQSATHSLIGLACSRRVYNSAVLI